eukprot:CAMPEP_0113451612 /NCGR_PEP_ID=MMETSP0014_2-20120614/6426_1 /TAXON_ID=2857 /ORGANISM="Nitzschia sp." /LENGTH=469 /DNA_ID=CAMNT_0000342969 /DNA_START=107 /DNA_END=1516 /DNA_ORIENTATION=+ /assembly_acc=CAM_ASM_000159
MLDAKTIEDVYMSWHMIQQRCSASDYETAFAKILDEQIAKLSPRMVEQLGVIGMTVHSRAVVKQLDMLVECLGPDQDDFIGIIKDAGKKHAPVAASRDRDSSSSSNSADNDLLTSRSCLLMGEAIIRTVAFFLKQEDSNTTATAVDDNDNNNSSSRSWAHTQKAWNELLSLVFSVMRKEVRRYEKKQRQKTELKQQHKMGGGHDDGEDGETTEGTGKKTKKTKKKTTSSSRRPQSSRMILQTSSAHKPRGGRKPRSSRCLDVICLDDDKEDHHHHHHHEDTESSNSDSCDPMEKPPPPPRRGTSMTTSSTTPKGQPRSMRNIFSSSSGTPSSSKPRSIRHLLGRVDESESSANLTSPGTPRRRDQAVFCADSPSGSSTAATECTSPSGSLMSGNNHHKNGPKSAMTNRQQKMMNMSMNKTNGGSRRNVFALASPGLFRRSPQRTKSDVVHASKTRKGRQELLNAAKIDL